MTFCNALVVKKLPKTEFSYEIVEPLIWDGASHKITVPAGFVSDFASVPWFFQKTFPKMGTQSDAPSVLHDWLYATEYADRKTCDKIFLEALIERGVGKAKAYAMYWAVRAGGGFVWSKHDPQAVKKARKLGGMETWR